MLIEIKNLKKSFDKATVLKDISMTVSEGEVVSIIGSSGSGKSTLLRCINLLEHYQGGDILFEGHNILKYPDGLNQYPTVCHITTGHHHCWLRSGAVCVTACNGPAGPENLELKV
jgi:ABC-type polar amino acid transport system ATPase subunit